MPRRCGFLSAVVVCVFVLSSPVLNYATPDDPDSAFQGLVGEVQWGKIFQKSLGQGLFFKLELLGGRQSGQIGIYISILNERNPDKNKFVLLSELINGQEKNFVGVFVPGSAEPDWEAEAGELRAILDRRKNAGLDIKYFTDNLSRSDLEKVREANVTLLHHGLEEEQYERAREVLSRLNQVIGSFKILEYKISERPLRIDYLKFSFEPCILPTGCE
jgi:hypothetical protein